MSVVTVTQKMETESGFVVEVIKELGSPIVKLKLIATNGAPVALAANLTIEETEALSSVLIEALGDGKL